MDDKLKETLEKIKLIIADVDRDGDIDRDDIKKMIERALAITNVVVKVTPTDKDDKVFNAIVRPIVEAVLASI